ncbi:MAG: hypothetical protein QOJ56_3070, partial [Mycobacterium sp.]|nr:hypothetical protein [Mycobacterium sp.]
MPATAVPLLPSSPQTREETGVDLRLSEEHRAVRETFAALFRKEATPQRVRAAESSGLDKDLWRRFSETEALGIGVASDCGGVGGGLLELALVAEEAGRRLAPIPVAETAAAARLLGRLGEKELIGPVLTGSSIVSLATGPGPVEKQLLVDGAIADAILAVEGSSLLYVIRPAGLARTSRPNFGGLALARWPDGCERRCLAEGDSARTMFATALDEVRVLRAAALIGLAAEAVRIGSDYAKVRHAFGQPIAMYQAVAHPFADAVAA